MNVDTLLEKVQGGASAGRSFGPVIEGDGCLIVPVALHAGGGGGSDGEGAEAGSGGGFGFVSWPIGVYVVRDGTARWVPALDATRLAIGAIALARTLVRLRARRRSR
jgi:uncharacterized spore protein YtfJ